ncbi:MAG TPA: heat-inducible transcriptional repressor HrcA [Thermodesulfobacteriota bacterium]|jgi:heat-inducible transcriptional repressor|nr:heat-inducible transcriptional repressor HrcA [Thermodesulfobacteriota bacterium]
MMKLSERGKRLLHLIIDYYIKTGQPVGSFKLVDRYNLPWSSATVRSTMAELMDKGYLVQPHVSAGRIPTEKGIRFYVDSLLYPQRLSEGMRVVIRRLYKKIDGTIEEVMYETTRVLSDISHCAGVATLPSTRFMKMKSAELVKLGHRKVLVIIVFEGGMTEKTLVRVNREIPNDVFYRISDYLNKIAVGLTLDELKTLIVDRLKDQNKIYREFIESVIRFSSKVFEQKPKSDVFIKGQTSFFDNLQFSNPFGLKELFKAFEEKNLLADILDKVMKGDGTKVLVGSENGVMEGYSLIAAPYGSDKRRGTLGVLGPMRMDYSQIIPLVGYTARIVSKIVSEGE